MIQLKEKDIEIPKIEKFNPFLTAFLFIWSLSAVASLDISSAFNSLILGAGF